MSSNSNYVEIAEPYERKIGKVTFIISSYGNGNTVKTSGDLILQILESRVSEEGGKTNDRQGQT